MYALKEYILTLHISYVQFQAVQMKEEGHLMPRVPVENNDRMSLRIAAEEKTLLVRAAALQHTNLTEFVIRTAVATAKDVIDQSEQLALTEHDSLQVLDLLENPPKPNKKLMAAAFAMPKSK
jgi:uncharacterized protein (DUF1778 family)